jgi:hypothetical protein
MAFVAQTIVRQFPWEEYRSFVDVGCAQGAMTVQVHYANFLLIVSILLNLVLVIGPERYNSSTSHALAKPDLAQQAYIHNVDNMQYT